MKRYSRVLAAVFLFACTLLILFSCDLFEKPPDDDDDDDTRPVDTSLVLGRGYDLTGRYAYSPAIKAPLLDHDKLDNAGLVKSDPNFDSGIYRTCEGCTVTDYQESLATSASVSVSAEYTTGSFSGEVGAHFNSTRAGSTEYAFATNTSRITKASYHVEGRAYPADLMAYLSGTFASDLLSMTGTELIAKYGTHVMLGGVWGARLDYHLSAKKQSESQGTDVGAYAKARAEAKFGIGSVSGATEASVDTAYSSSFDTDTTLTTTMAYGGAVEYAQSVHNEGDYSAWIDSIKDKYVWFDYYPGSLQPIYEFIEDETKKAEVTTAYGAHFTAAGIHPVTPEIPVDPVVRASIFNYSSFVTAGFAYNLYDLFETNDLRYLYSSSTHKVTDYATGIELAVAVNTSDQISSVRVNPGYILTLYDGIDYAGERFQFVGDWPQVPVNDTASSLKITAYQGGGSPIVTIYDAADYNTTGFRYKDYYTEFEDPNLGIYMNDRTSSVQIHDSRYKVILYWAADFGTPYPELNESDPNLTDNNCNDEVSSLKVMLKPIQ